MDEAPCSCGDHEATHRDVWTRCGKRDLCDHCYEALVDEGMLLTGRALDDAIECDKVMQSRRDS